MSLPSSPTNHGLAVLQTMISRRAAGRWLLAIAATPFLAGCRSDDGDPDDGYGIVGWDDAAETGPKPGDRAPNV